MTVNWIELNTLIHLSRIKPMNLSDIKAEICQLLNIDKINAKEAKQLNLISDVNWSLKETWLNLLNTLKANEFNVEDDFNLWDELTNDIEPSSKTVDSLKLTLFGFIVELKLVSFTNLIEFNYKQQVVINYILNLIKLQPKAPSNCYNWHYLEHIATGSYKEIKSPQELKDLNILIDTLNSILEPVKQIKFSKSVLKIQMKPKHITIENINDRTLNRIEKQAQKNNDYKNRRRTLMSTNESPGKNVGQPSVKESILYKPAKLVAEPFIRNGKANINGILSISVNGHQVYPCSLVSYLDESNPALDLLDDATKELILSSNKLKVDELTPQQLASLKTYKRRKEIATNKVKQYSFQHCRGKIQNGFSPSFETNGKKYCFQIDQENRVKLWKLSNDISYTVTPDDLIKGRELCDVGYLEVKSYTVKQWVNLTLDMIKGGQEARLERFDYITKQLNKQVLINNQAVFNYMSKLKDNKNNALEVQNLKVVDELITGQLYSSELIIAKRDVHKHKVVLHPTAKVPEQYVTIANIWINSLPGGELFHKTNKPNNLGLNNINNRTRKEIKKNIGLKPIQNSKDKKYMIKMLSKFTVDGIYSDKDKTEFLGKLVKTDGSSLIERKREIIHYTEIVDNKEIRKTRLGAYYDDYSLIERIVTRLLDTFPSTIKVATLMTPSHYPNSDEFSMFLLRLLKFYGQVELGILINGRIQLITDNTDTVFINWCNGLYQYLKRQNAAVGVITISDALSMLKKYSYSKEKEILLTNIPTAAYNNGQLLEDIAGRNTTKIKSFQAEIEKLSGMYDSLIYDLRFKNGLENE